MAFSKLALRPGSGGPAHRGGHPSLGLAQRQDAPSTDRTASSHPRDARARSARRRCNSVSTPCLSAPGGTDFRLISTLSAAPSAPARATAPAAPASFTALGLPGLAGRVATHPTPPPAPPR